MTSSTETSVVSRAGVRTRKLRPWNIVVWLIVLILILVLAFYAIGGWYFSGEIYSGAIQVQPPEVGDFDITFDRGEAEALVLRGDENAANLLDDGRFGLMWESGESLVDGIVSSDTAGGQSTVFRTRVPDEPIPAPGSPVRLDSYIWSGDPRTALGIPFSEITYQIEGGNADAWYVEGSSDTWMIFVHGKGAPKNEALRLLPLAVERGYHAMVIDYRNDPGAPPDPSGTYQYGVTEWKDVASATRHARSRGGRNVIIVGYSMGGANVLSFLLESPLRSQTAAVILDSPVLNLGSIIDHAADQTSLPLTSIPVPQSLTSVAKWIAGWRYGIDWNDTDYVERSRDLQTPMLIIQGSGDKTVPSEPADELARLRPDIVTLSTPPGVGHVLAWNADTDGYEALITTFLDNLGV
ncbi:MAG: alpha/beta hydrolase [Acidimicrobiia bacterium]